MSQPKTKYFTFNPYANVEVVFSGKGHNVLPSMINDFQLQDLKLVQAEQEHGVNIYNLETNENSYIPGVDALICDKKNQVLLIRTADCMPVFIYDRVSQVAGAIHAGLRGSLGNIVCLAIGRMRELYGSKTSDLMLFLGPCIHKCCYEVEEKILFHVREHRNFSDFALYSSSGHYFFDLLQYNIIRLREAGINDEQIQVSDHCTSCESDMFFSHRARRDSLRMFSFILMRQEG